MLAHVERREVETEGPYATQHAADVEHARLPPAIVGEAPLDQLQVVDELPDPVVLAGTAVVRGAQPLGHLPEEYAVWHAVVACRHRCAGAGDQAPVGLYAGVELRRHRDAAFALAQLLRQDLHLLEVAVDDQLMVPVAALANGLGVHVGVTVHVAAHP